jgi:YggT family protein
MTFVIIFLIRLLDFYIWAVIASAIMSWLIAFDIIDLTRKPFGMLHRILIRITEPPTYYLRRVVPIIGGIDVTPIILIFGISMLQRLLYGLL